MLDAVDGCLVSAASVEGSAGHGNRSGDGFKCRDKSRTVLRGIATFDKALDCASDKCSGLYSDPLLVSEGYSAGRICAYSMCLQALGFNKPQGSLPGRSQKLASRGDLRVESPCRLEHVSLLFVLTL